MQPNECQTCGKTLPPDAPSGICPHCLLKAGLADSAPAAANEATLDSDVEHHRDSFDGAVPESGISEPYACPIPGTKVRYFGDYELLEELARGGMGVVFRARQTRLNRTVALKLILTGSLATDTDVRRFQTEAEAAAQLDHPGIVPIFEVGQHEGHHFYSMALVNGPSLAERLSERPMEAKNAARLVRDVALSIQYAHEKGVIHRDLKPANILIDEAGKPRVTDFGLAKQVAERDGVTCSGQILGTPSYMAPEQALGKSDEISKLTDVYAPGAILYAALCGHPPHQADNPLDTLKLIVDSDPVAPRQWNPGLPKDLETICLTCLNRKTGQRYASAKMLAEELARFEEGKPILARPVGRSTRLWRWCLRNRGVAALTATSILLLVVGALVASGLAIYSDRQRALAMHQLERANSELYRNHISLADSEMKFGNADSAQRILANSVAQGQPPEGLGWEWNYLARSTLLSPSQFVREQTLPVVGVDVSRRGNRLVRLTQNGSVDVFDQQSLRLLNRFDVGEEVEPGIAVNEDGTLALINTKTRSMLIRLSDGHEVWSSEAERVSVLGLDGKTVFGQVGIELHSWDTETGQRHWSVPLPSSGSNRRDMQADADGRVFVLDELLLRVFDQSTGELYKELSAADVLPPDGRPRPSWYIHSVHPESGKIILLENSLAQRIFVADIENRRPAVEAGGVFRGLALAPSGIGAPQFSHDGSLLAYAIDRVDFLENSDAAASRAESEFLDSSELLAEWRIDGSKRFAWPSTNRVRIVDMKTGKLLRTLKGFSGSKLNGLTFTPDGTRLIAWGGHIPKAFWPVPDQPFSEMRVWDVSQTGTVILQGHSEAIRQVAFTPDSQHILSSAEDGTVCVWDTNSGQLLRVFDRHLYDAETGKRLQIWDRRLDRQRHLRHSSRLVRAVQLSLLGQSDQAVSALGSRLLVWKIETGEVVHEFEATGKLRSRLAMNPQGTQVAYATQQVTIHQLPSGEVAAEWETTSGVGDLAWSPDGTQIATVVGGESLAELKIIETDTQKCVFQVDFSEGKYVPFYTEGFRPSSICYLPNKPYVVVGGANGLSMVIDTESGQLLEELPGHTSAVLGIAVSPDGSRIATASFDSTVRLWSADSGQLMHTFRDHSKPVNSIAFSNDGQNLAAGGDDGKVFVWKAGL